jgi:membrane-bound lytic murein transglycosylase B
VNARARALAATLLLATPVVSLSATAERPLDLDQPNVVAFIERMEAEHDISAAETRAVLGSAAVQPKIIEAMTRPAEKVKPWHEYRQIFITDKRIDAGVAFWTEHAETLDRVYRETGVPPQIIVGIIGVETFYGRITGGYRVVDALATLAFEYPPRSKFFTSELEQFLLLTREQEIDPLLATGSYAGAMGGPQFISSSYRAYAVDGSGDGKVDLWDSWEDIISSVANYFTAHGWQRDGTVVTAAQSPVPADARSAGLKLDRTVGGLREAGVTFGGGDSGDPAMLFELEGAAGPEFWVGFKNFYVITRYNRSNMYAMAVHQLGQAIEDRRAGASGDA